ncbi:MAG: hypothetical protein R3301_16205, partial [Saprospiraceae bacterium]|nr:hypothetical protein [Saprospiraceae bacterium]
PVIACPDLYDGHGQSLGCGVCGIDQRMVGTISANGDEVPEAFRDGCGDSRTNFSNIVGNADIEGNPLPLQTVSDVWPFAKCLAAARSGVYYNKPIVIGRSAH